MVGKYEWSREGSGGINTQIHETVRHRIPREQVPCGKHIKSNSANEEFNLLLQTWPSLHPGILSEIESQYSRNIAQLVEHFA